MDTDQLLRNWKLIQGKVAENWGKLTDHDLATIGGKRDQLVGMLQQRYDKAPGDIEREVQDFEARVATLQ